MKKKLTYIAIPIVFILIGWFANTAYHLPKDSGLGSKTISLIKPTPFLKYTIDNAASIIEIGDILKEDLEFTSYKYSMKFSPDFSENLKTVTGVINIPKGQGPYPVIIMFRGFVDQKIYTAGMGTQPSAIVFAKNGYITIAPDFLGYAGSSGESADIFESRFQTYVTAAVTLKSIEACKEQPFKVGSKDINIDTENIFIWGHSNGGQVALTTLEITGVNYPTVLWAPVSMRFPASILYYLADALDGGKFLISKLAEFEETYDAEEFSPTNHFEDIKASIQINQGTADTAVPYWLSDSLFKTLKNATVSATYIKYPGNDHNMRPNWNDVVDNNITFFKKNTI
jgi:dipeptidyl aminopeptidase/acylaminoacyl peptidase